MRKIRTKFAKPGMRLASHIYNDAGGVQLPAGTGVDSSIRAKLEEMGITEIWVYDERVADIVMVDSIPPEILVKAKETLRAQADRASSAQSLEAMRPDYEGLMDLVRDIKEGLDESGSDIVNLIPIERPQDFPYTHPINVAMLCMAVAAKSGLLKRIADIGLGALLCDAGLWTIPREHRENPSSLSGEDLEAYMKHPETSLKILRLDPRFSSYTRAIAYQHQERHDGSGYPRGLKGDDINPLARIVSVADTYCSLVSSGNPLGMKLKPQEAVEYMLSAAGFEFDHVTVLGVMHYVAPYPVGTMVRLNTGEKGVVTKVYKGLTTRPTVRVLYDANGGEIEPYEIVLAANQNQTILVQEVCED